MMCDRKSVDMLGQEAPGRGNNKNRGRIMLESSENSKENNVVAVQ